MGAAPRTWTTMIKLQRASMPFFPSTSSISCPIGKGRSVARRSDTEAVANEAAIKSSQPRDAVAPTLTRMAKGAARAAPAVSSEMWAAESSKPDGCRFSKNFFFIAACHSQPVNVHMGAVNASMKAQPPDQDASARPTQ
ncbi:hypothetical protein PHLCEN_2v10839 [Hermanssonia centrifuga]|uniref:Uncharacterized protein n=1 Tax=Hermanssonia centrifuga TaxID=98765 RepID=A0A2R6NLW7_9APHY|nr:hypothetical protein PHLCEN_2v10839 [Hermanssonia centrifuga]